MPNATETVAQKVWRKRESWDRNGIFDPSQTLRQCRPNLSQAQETTCADSMIGREEGFGNGLHLPRSDIGFQDCRHLGYCRLSLLLCQCVYPLFCLGPYNIPRQKQLKQLEMRARQPPRQQNVSCWSTEQHQIANLPALALSSHTPTLPPLFLLRRSKTKTLVLRQVCRAASEHKKKGVNPATLRERDCPPARHQTLDSFLVCLACMFPRSLVRLPTGCHAVSLSLCPKSQIGRGGVPLLRQPFFATKVTCPLVKYQATRHHTDVASPPGPQPLSVHPSICRMNQNSSSLPRAPKPSFPRTRSPQCLGAIIIPPSPPFSVSRPSHREKKSRPPPLARPNLGRLGALESTSPPVTRSPFFRSLSQRHRGNHSRVLVIQQAPKNGGAVITQPPSRVRDKYHHHHTAFEPPSVMPPRKVVPCLSPTCSPRHGTHLFLPPSLAPPIHHLPWAISLTHESPPLAGTACRRAPPTRPLRR